MFLSIKYDIGRKYESYGLKNIIKQEGLEKEKRTFYDASKIRENYKDPIEWEKIKQYCIDDAEDALMLFELMIKPFFFLNRSIPRSFQSLMESASGGQLNSMMVRAYLQQGHSIPKPSEKVKYPGAISIGNPGNYSNCVKWDVASLYPSIMLNYRIENKEKDPKGYMLEILDTFTNERLKNKKLAKETGNSYYDSLQNSQKIVINSIYGFLGTDGINFNYPEGAALVTKYGREILEKAIEWATGSKLIYELEIENNG
jgi:DNA polymerase elongation subunit (family B)